MTQTVSSWELFAVFAKVGAFTIGGGMAMIPLIEKEISDRGWASAEELDDIIVLAQSAPGLLAVNTAIFTGYRLAGLKGSIMASIGAVLPSFVIILLVAIFFSDIRHNPVVDAAFRAMRPAVVALIVAPVVGLAKGMRPWLVAVSAATALAVWWLGISPVYLLIAGAAAGLLWSAYTVRKEGGR